MTKIYSVDDKQSINVQTLYRSSNCIDISSTNSHSATSETEQQIKDDRIFILQSQISDLKSQLNAERIAGINEGKALATIELTDKLELLNKQQDKVEKELELFSRLCSSIDSAIDVIKKNFYSELNDIIMLSVLKIVGEDFVFSENRINNIVTPYLDDLKLINATVIFLSPLDYELLTGRPEAMARIPSHIRVECSDALDRCDFIVKGENGELNHRLLMKLEKFKNLLVEHQSL